VVNFVWVYNIQKATSLLTCNFKTPMHKIFTPEDVIRFAYKEMSSAEEAAFTIELADCDEAVAELSTIRSTTEWLDESAGQPKHSTIQNLLNYSRALRIENTSIDGLSVEVVLN
jgi:hypothetical protein